MSTSAKAKTIIPKVTKALAWKYFTENNNGTTVTQKRASIAPEKVGACVIVKSNLGLLRHMGMRSK